MVEMTDADWQRIYRLADRMGEQAEIERRSRGCLVDYYSIKTASTEEVPPAIYRWLGVTRVCAWWRWSPHKLRGCGLWSPPSDWSLRAGPITVFVGVADAKSQQHYTRNFYRKHQPWMLYSSEISLPD